VAKEANEPGEKRRRSPSVPLPAASTMYPAVSSALLMKSQIRGSSSTRRMRGAATPSACPSTPAGSGWPPA